MTPLTPKSRAELTDLEPVFQIAEAGTCYGIALNPRLC